MEKDFQSAPKRFWQTIRRLKRGSMDPSKLCTVTSGPQAFSYILHIPNIPSVMNRPGPYPVPEPGFPYAPPTVV
ncbi:hypothetical protein NHX12_027761 [Muraenolepis orangiensis]|uniref:Uncharacterized protein n=1 Tax=Muraenolepis orangiensis TaxID=630683 RepID=A0A9Q0EJL4_9TELE|nr:hypothetical protein NHX12_027761 [Muraenolepis orangiensis]